MQGFPSAIHDFADTFVALQEMRHQADYALELVGLPDKQGTLAAIDRAEDAIKRLK